MGGVRAVTVSSWPGLMEELYRDSWDPAISRFRSSLVFRGVRDDACDLSTGLMRLAAGYPDLVRLEGHILRNFRKYAQPESAVGNSLWNWLALAQHHGLPSRLLDWTYSPLVALHFATEDLSCYERDGAIWCVDHRQTNRLLPPPLRAQAEREGLDVFTAEMLDSAADSLDALARLSEDDFVVFLEPPSLDSRIVNQFALFSLMSNPIRKLDDWLAERPELAKKIVLPAALKWELRDKLDQAGVTERMLYPGLDGLSRWLTRYYTPRRQDEI
jgi:hypothetical protein